MVQLMTNEQVLLAAGISRTEIDAIKTLNATTAVNTLDAIHNRLMSYVSSQRIEVANLTNPLKALEKGYADLNKGSLNGFFQETLIQMRDIGTDKLYGGKKYNAKNVRNPFSEQDYGKEPIQFTYGINAKIERFLEYNRNDFLMALQSNALGDYISAKLATLEQENSGSRYFIENKVLNCEHFQNKKYSESPVFADAYSLNEYMFKIFDMQNYPETNKDYKKIPYNSTKGQGKYFIILNSMFAFKFAQKFQMSNYLKPFLFKSQDSDTFGVTEERSTLITVDNLLPTTLNENEILNPLNMVDATLGSDIKLIGRIVDFNAVKFGVGKKDAVSYPLNARTMHYDEVHDYCFNMCEAYVNVPLLINEATFSYDRVLQTQNKA